MPLYTSYARIHIEISAPEAVFVAFRRLNPILQNTVHLPLQGGCTQPSFARPEATRGRPDAQASRRRPICRAPSPHPAAARTTTSHTDPCFATCVARGIVRHLAECHARSNHRQGASTTLTSMHGARRHRFSCIQNAWDGHEPTKPSRMAPYGAWPSCRPRRLFDFEANVAM